MNSAQTDLSGDSGRNHLKPFLTGLAISVAVAAVSLLLASLPL